MKFDYVGNNCFPVDTDEGFWVPYGTDLATLLKLISDKWPGKDLDSVQISPVHHHEFSIGYDLYDSSDYVNYLYISLEE